MPIISTIDCIYSNPAYFSSSRFSFQKSFCAGLTNGNIYIIDVYLDLI